MMDIYQELYQQTYPALYDAEVDRKHMDSIYAEVLRETFPVGALVIVNHHRGQYFGTVTGHDPYFHRVEIQNNSSGKLSYRYPSCTDIHGRLSIEIIHTKPPAGKEEGSNG